MDIISKWHTAQVIYHYLEGTIPEKDSAIRRPTAESSDPGLQTPTRYNIDTGEEPTGRGWGGGDKGKLKVQMFKETRGISLSLLKL